MAKTSPNFPMITHVIGSLRPTLKEASILKLAFSMMDNKPLLTPPQKQTGYNH